MSTAPEDRLKLMVQLSDELDQREAGYLVRAAGVNTRATILISAATIVGALQVTHAGGLWIDIAMGFAVLASALALFVIWHGIGPPTPFSNGETRCGTLISSLLCIR
jgi:hypothetical protein